MAAAAGCRAEIPPATGLLSEAAQGSRVRIENLPSHPVLRNRLLAMGIRPGVQLEVLRRGHPGGILHLAHGLLEFMLRREHAREIFVHTAPPGAAPPPPTPRTEPEGLQRASEAG